MLRRNRSMSNRSHETKAKSEKAHIEAEEMLDAAEVHYMCFGEFLFPSALVRPIE
jgi:hypothetical protein